MNNCMSRSDVIECTIRRRPAEGGQRALSLSVLEKSIQESVYSVVQLFDSDYAFEQARTGIFPFF
jgi:hypothetical protein